MIDIEPIKEYISARDDYLSGDRFSALVKLYQSIGCEEMNDYINQNLGELLNLNEVALTLVVSRSKK